jgi:hypothetical protein
MNFCTPPFNVTTIIKEKGINVEVKLLTYAHIMHEKTSYISFGIIDRCVISVMIW